MPHKVKFMSATMQISDKPEVLKAIATATPESKVTIATVNPEFMLEAGHNADFQKALAEMSHAIIDGSGLFFMLNIWKRKAGLPEITLYHGSDLVADLFEAYRKGEKSFYFLGGAPGNAERAREAITKKYPHISIVGTDDGGMINPANPTASKEVLDRIKEAKPDILTVAFGAPKQELWINAASKELTVPVMIGVGGTLDFYTKKKRAPKWLRFLHLEWLGRVFSEKGHWKRAYRAVIIFPLKAAFWMLSNLAKDSK
jgi:N-acetylglucosaminyldiphosphoundecaprenol N-acetyl-beta-D-mannosaminyltransferase